MTEEEPRTVRDEANDAYDVMHAVGRAVPYSCPAPTVYAVVGNLKSAGGYFLAHALDSMADGLGRSLGDHDVYEDARADGQVIDPAESAAVAQGHLRRAAQLARQVATEMEAAQTAINRQGYRTPGDVGYRKPEDRK